MPDARGSDDNQTPPGPDDATSDPVAAPKDGGDADPTADLKNSYRAALDRKTGRNSHAESHLIGRQVGGGNNETHKRTFRRKSG